MIALEFRFIIYNSFLEYQNYKNIRIFFELSTRPKIYALSFFLMTFFKTQENNNVPLRLARSVFITENTNLEWNFFYIRKVINVKSQSQH